MKTLILEDKEKETITVNELTRDSIILIYHENEIIGVIIHDNNNSWVCRLKNGLVYTRKNVSVSYKYLEGCVFKVL